MSSQEACDKIPVLDFQKEHIQSYKTELYKYAY